MQMGDQTVSQTRFASKQKKKHGLNLLAGVARFFLPANTTVLNPILSTAYE